MRAIDPPTPSNKEHQQQPITKNLWLNILAKTFSRVTSRSKEQSNFKKSCSLTAKSKAKLTRNADIRGEIKTKSITVFGKVQGNITVSERCELKSKCTLQGDLKAARLVIEEGATFVGKSEVTSGMSVTAAKSSSSRPEIVRNDESAKPAFARA